MCRRELPRVYELIDLIEDRTSPCAYFQNFEDSLRVERQKRQVWLAREAELDRLANDAWDFLKGEANPYLTRRGAERGWQQLITILNQARAYGYLQSIGCSTLRFIPRGATRTPDLKGELNGYKVLSEVKTINISDTEASVRRCGDVRIISDRLEDGFFNKLRSDLKTAKGQMKAYDGEENTRRIVFFIVNFDDLLAEYKAEYYKQIDEYLTRHPVYGIEIVFYNERTAFHAQIAMKSATAVNE